MIKKYDYTKDDIEIAEENGISLSTFYQRLRYGWSANKARSYPIRNHTRNKDVYADERFKPRKPKTYEKPRPWLDKYPQVTEFGDYAQQLFKDCFGSW